MDKSGANDDDTIKSSLATLPKTQILLWDRLHPKLQRGELDHNSGVEEFLKFATEQGRLHRVRELGKSNPKAAKFRNAGNRYYLEKKFDEALVWYNESICFAETGSDQLGMGFANRSAVYFEQGEYEFALYNIDLAKKNNYPEKLMPKLLDRELNCRQQISLGNSKESVPQVRMNINVDINPKIPFLGKGISMGYDSKFERGLIAERDFNTGNVILDEKIELCGVDFNLSYTTCNQCTSEFNYSLIPCPNCPLFMYCSEECRKLNWDLYHRFECAVATKLCCGSRVSGMVTPRFFFYGLSQLNDDVQNLMNVCEFELSTDPNPLEVDYSNLDRLEVFKALHHIKPSNDTEFEVCAKVSAASYYVVFMTNPVIRSIIRTAPLRRFFLQSLEKYMYLANVSIMSNTTWKAKDNLSASYSPVGSLCNHSCDPNVVKFLNYGRLKMVVLRPIRKGEQIFASDGPKWWKNRPTHPLGFDCQCPVCDKGETGRKWHRKNQAEFPVKETKNVKLMKDVLFRDDVNLATKLNAVQQLIKRYDHMHPQRHIGALLEVNNSFLITALEAENVALVRAKLRAEYAEV